MLDIPLNIPKSIIYDSGKLQLLDQRLLPNTEKYINIDNLIQGFDAIKELAVRGAPAIGIAAAYMLVIELRDHIDKNINDFKVLLFNAGSKLKSARPTAVNLFYTINRLLDTASNYNGKSSIELFNLLETEAIKIEEEDRYVCKRIGELGAELITDKYRVLTHCNAGALAVSEFGTALAPIYHAYMQGREPLVYSCETRPLLQGARLTAYELNKAGVDVKLITDNSAGYIISKGLIDIIIVGADRVAKNGDTANKIGTLTLAILANYYKIPFYIAMPFSTYDIECLTGEDIIVEERSADEVRYIADKLIAPKDIKVLNYAFDITPHYLITGYITEKGILKYDEL